MLGRLLGCFGGAGPAAPGRRSSGDPPQGVAQLHGPGRTWDPLASGASGALALAVVGRDRPISLDEANRVILALKTRIRELEGSNATDIFQTGHRLGENGRKATDVTLATTSRGHKSEDEAGKEEAANAANARHHHFRAYTKAELVERLRRSVKPTAAVLLQAVCEEDLLGLPPNLLLDVEMADGTEAAQLAQLAHGQAGPQASGGGVRSGRGGLGQGQWPEQGGVGDLPDYLRLRLYMVQAWAARPVLAHANAAARRLFDTRSDRQLQLVLEAQIQQDAMLAILLQELLDMLLRAPAVLAPGPDPGPASHPSPSSRSGPHPPAGSHATLLLHAVSHFVTTANSRVFPFVPVVMSACGYRRSCGSVVPCVLLEFTPDSNQGDFMQHLQRDYTMMGHIGAIITLFDLKGHVLHQNAGSISYYGYRRSSSAVKGASGKHLPGRGGRAGKRAGTAALMLGSSGAAAGSVGGGQGTSEDEGAGGGAAAAAAAMEPLEDKEPPLLNQLFALSAPDTLDGMLEAMVQGGMWKSILPVPPSGLAPTHRPPPPASGPGGTAPLLPAHPGALHRPGGGGRGGGAYSAASPFLADASVSPDPDSLFTADLTALSVALRSGLRSFNAGNSGALLSALGGGARSFTAMGNRQLAAANSAGGDLGGSSGGGAFRRPFVSSMVESLDGPVPLGKGSKLGPAAGGPGGGEGGSMLKSANSRGAPFARGSAALLAVPERAEEAERGSVTTGLTGIQPSVRAGASRRQFGSSLGPDLGSLAGPGAGGSSASTSAEGNAAAGGEGGPPLAVAAAAAATTAAASTGSEACEGGDSNAPATQAAPSALPSHLQRPANAIRRSFSASAALAKLVTSSLLAPTIAPRGSGGPPLSGVSAGVDRAAAGQGAAAALAAGPLRPISVGAGARASLRRNVMLMMGPADSALGGALTSSFWGLAVGGRGSAKGSDPPGAGPSSGGSQGSHASSGSNSRRASHGPSALQRVSSVSQLSRPPLQQPHLQPPPLQAPPDEAVTTSTEAAATGLAAVPSPRPWLAAAGAPAAVAGTPAAVAAAVHLAAGSGLQLGAPAAPYPSTCLMVSPVASASQQPDAAALFWTNTCANDSLAGGPAGGSGLAAADAAAAALAEAGSTAGGGGATMAARFGSFGGAGDSRGGSRGGSFRRPPMRQTDRSNSSVNLPGPSSGAQAGPQAGVLAGPSQTRPAKTAASFSFGSRPPPALLQQLQVLQQLQQAQQPAQAQAAQQAQAQAQARPLLRMMSFLGTGTGGSASGAQPQLQGGRRASQTARWSGSVHTVERDGSRVGAAPAALLDTLVGPGGAHGPGAANAPASPASFANSSTHARRPLTTRQSFRPRPHDSMLDAPGSSLGAGLYTTAGACNSGAGGREFSNRTAAGSTAGNYTIPGGRESSTLTGGSATGNNHPLTGGSGGGNSGGGRGRGGGGGSREGAGGGGSGEQLQELVLAPPAGRDGSGGYRRASYRGGDDGVFHEVTATSFLDPVTNTQAVMVVQMDVTARVRLERRLADVMEAEHKLLENIFPRHVLEHIATSAAVNSASASQFNLSMLNAMPDPTKTATDHEQCTILFSDIVGFTQMCKEVPAKTVMRFLNDLYTRFDSLLDIYGVYKVETIGDCYMVAGGLISRDADGFAAVRKDSNDKLQAWRVISFAKAMLRDARKVLLPTTGEPVKMRVGVHTGPVVSGIVGTRMPRFCLFGDTINTASRMESTSPYGRVQVSAATHALVPDEEWEATGGVEVKGKGIMETFLLRTTIHTEIPEALAAATNSHPSPGERPPSRAPQHGRYARLASPGPGEVIGPGRGGRGGGSGSVRSGRSISVRGEDSAGAGPLRSGVSSVGLFSPVGTEGGLAEAMAAAEAAPAGPASKSGGAGGGEGAAAAGREDAGGGAASSAPMAAAAPPLPPPRPPLLPPPSDSKNYSFLFNTVC